MSATTERAERTAGARRRGPAAVGVGPLLSRAIGVLVWRLAEPESLPVPPAEDAGGGAADGGATAGVAPAPDRAARDGAAPGRAAPGRAARHPAAAAIGAASVAAAAIGLALVVIGGAATLAMRGLGERFAATAPGTPLDETATRLESATAGRWWAIFYPTFGARLARAADSVRGGRDALADLAAAYDACRAEMAARGPAGRLLDGAELARPVAAALARVAWPWHRGTLAFREMHEAIAPYASASGAPIARLRGTIVAAPPGHALAVSLAGEPSIADAAEPSDPARAERPIEVGGRFDLPFDPGARARVSDWLRPRPGDALGFVEEKEIPLAAWPDGEIAFPREGAVFAIRLDDEWAKRAPALPALSEAARREVGLADPKSGRRSGS